MTSGGNTDESILQRCPLRKVSLHNAHAHYNVLLYGDACAFIKISLSSKIDTSSETTAD